MAVAAGGPRRRLRLLVSHLIVAAVAALVGASAFFIANGYALPQATPPPGTVVLDNVQVDYFYLNGTPQIFGPNQQELCSLCPLTLTGGTTFTIGTILVQYLPGGNATTFWLNATSPIPFEEWSCSWSGARPAGWPPTGCPFTTDWHGGASTYEVGSGGTASITYPLTLSIPNPVPSLPGGFDVQLVFAVEMVPFSASAGS
jgi:hypothetical protein